MGDPTNKGLLVIPVAFDPSDDMMGLEVDADHALKVAFSEAAKGLVGGHGWIGGAWQKSPLPLGYSGIISEEVSDLTLDEGNNVLGGTVVPAGEVWVISAASIKYVGDTATALTLFAFVDSVPTRLIYQVDPTSGAIYLITGQFILAEGDYMQYNVATATANDDGILDYMGYSFDIDQ